MGVVAELRTSHAFGCPKMKKILLLLLPLIFLAVLDGMANAQIGGGVSVFGNVTPNDCASFLNGNTIQDSGSPCGSGGSGTVTSVSVVTANGVSGTVATPTTTPAITISLGAITPSSVAIGGATIGSNALAVAGITSLGNGNLIVAANGSLTITGGNFSTGGNSVFVSSGTGFLSNFNGGVVGWTNSSSASGTLDTGFSRDTGGIIDVGTGAQGSKAGSINLTNLTASGDQMIGSATPLTLVAGEQGFAKIAASGSAPGAAGAKISWVCGTNSGTAKMVASAGTSIPPVTIIDNVGGGVTGC
jgi:hypothetical protein